MVKTKKATKEYNLFAILALIFTFLFYPVGLIFAFVALSQIKKTGEKGKWMACIPIVLFGIFVAFIFIWIIFYLGVRNYF